MSSLTPQQSRSLLNLAAVRRVLMTDPRLVTVLQRHDAAFKRRCEMRHRDHPVPGCLGCDAIAAAKVDWYEIAHQDLSKVLEVINDLRLEAGAYPSPVTAIAQ